MSNPDISERLCWCGYARDATYPLSGAVHGRPDGKMRSPSKHLYRAVTDEELASRVRQLELL